MAPRHFALLAITAGLLGGCKSSPTKPDEATGKEPVLPGPPGPPRPSGPPGPPGPSGIWKPTPGTSWQWQLSGTIDTSLAVAMYDIDLFDAPDAVLSNLHARGITIVCYFSAGSHEPSRADAAELPADAIGRALEGWPDEHWLDIRSAAVRTLMKARLARAKERGCDAVEPDNVDGYTNRSGFPLTAADQLDFNRFLAREAHALGLSIGLKNDLDQVRELVSEFDWALVEECLAYDECAALAPFIAANKAVFHVEYGADARAGAVCPKVKPLRFDTLIKNVDLDARRVACR